MNDLFSSEKFVLYNNERSSSHPPNTTPTGKSCYFCFPTVHPKCCIKYQQPSHISPNTSTVFGCQWIASFCKFWEIISVIICKIERGFICTCVCTHSFTVANRYFYCVNSSVIQRTDWGDTYWKTLAICIEYGN